MPKKDAKGGAKGKGDKGAAGGSDDKSELKMELKFAGFDNFAIILIS